MLLFNIYVHVGTDDELMKGGNGYYLCQCEDFDNDCGSDCANCDFDDPVDCAYVS